MDAPLNRGASGWDLRWQDGMGRSLTEASHQGVDRHGLRTRFRAAKTRTHPPHQGVAQACRPGPARHPRTPTRVRPMMRPAIGLDPGSVCMPPCSRARRPRRPASRPCRRLASRLSGCRRRARWGHTSPAPGGPAHQGDPPSFSHKASRPGPRDLCTRRCRLARGNPAPHGRPAPRRARLAAS